MGDAGLSDFTKRFSKEKNGLLGSASRSAKFVEVDINRQKDYIDFYFLSDATPKYPDNHEYKNAEIPSYALQKNPSKTYTIIIRVLDFFKWLGTTPSDITNKDIEDVLNSANIQIASDCPSYHWQGSNWVLSQFDGSIYPTSIPPNHWKKYHRDDNFLDKHTQGIINNIKFFIPQMRQKIKKAVTL
jgi:hypothetical protein